MNTNATAKDIRNSVEAPTMWGEDTEPVAAEPTLDGALLDCAAALARLQDAEPLRHIWDPWCAR